MSGTCEAYGRLCAEFYDLDKPVPPPAEMDVWLGACRRAKGPVLEAMCGSGRFLIPLLQAGIDVDGVDSSKAMLDACARRAAGAGLHPALYMQKIEDLKLRRRYALIFIAGGSFALVVDRTAETLRQLRAQLLDGGKFLVELDLHASSSGSGHRSVAAADGESLNLTWTTLKAEVPDIALVRCRYERVRGGHCEELEEEILRLRERTPTSLREDLEDAGFRDVRFEPGPNGWVVEATAR